MTHIFLMVLIFILTQIFILPFVFLIHDSIKGLFFKEKEQTLIIFKPDCVKSGLELNFMNRFCENNEDLQIKKMVKKVLTKEDIEKHYAKFIDKPFFPEIVEFMTSGESVVAVLSGINVIDNVRTEVFLIRDEYHVDKMKNLIHASDSEEAAELEINNFFGE